MPVYNSELYIREAIDSILNQTFSDFEFIIIDDASTDKSVEIIQSYTDSRIQLIVKPQNSGYTNSLNYGLKIAKGEYIARMDSDDISLPTRFEKQVAYLDRNPDVVLCGANYTIIGTDNVYKLTENNDEIQMYFITDNCIAHPVVMLRNSVLKKYAILYDVTKEPAEDFDLWVRLFNYGKLHNLQEVLLNYRVHEQQVSNIQSEKQQNISIDTKINIFKNLNINWNDIEEKVLRKHLSNIFFINLKELEILKKVNYKILQSNETKLVFNHQLLSDYLRKEEKRLLLRYFTSNMQYKPQVLLEYFMRKKEIIPQLSLKNQMKLVIKCLSFYKKK